MRVKPAASLLPNPFWKCHHAPNLYMRLRVLGQRCRHQAGRRQLARLRNVLTGRHSFRRTHSTGLLPVGNKDTVSRHVHRELNPKVPRCPVICTPHAATSVPRLRHLALFAENQKQTLSSKTNLFLRTSHMFSDVLRLWRASGLEQVKHSYSF